MKNSEYDLLDEMKKPMGCILIDAFIMFDKSNNYVREGFNPTLKYWQGKKTNIDERMKYPE